MDALLSTSDEDEDARDAEAKKAPGLTRWL